MTTFEQSLRAYEAAHRRWMNTSVFTAEGQRAKDELKTAREAYEEELGKARTIGRVYVDAAVWPYGRMRMCHMVADTLDALHAMADKIGIARRWFQNKPGFPHYDICKAKRALAVKHGAVEISWRELVALRKRGATPAPSPAGSSSSTDE